MNYTLVEKTSAIAISLILFAGMGIFFFIGRAFGKRWKAEKSDEKSEKSGILQTAMLGLFAFILAFAFGMSGTRYENALNVLVEESNNIGTAILRADLYPDSVRKEMRYEFKKYLEARLILYKNLPDTEEVSSTQQLAMEQAEDRLWKLAMTQSKTANTLIQSYEMIPALNAMFDIASTRKVMLRTNIPDIVVYVLLVLGLVCSFIIGVNSPTTKAREKIVILCFALFSSLVVYLTLDLGRPLHGAIRVRASEQAIINLQNMFTEVDK